MLKKAQDNDEKRPFNNNNDLRRFPQSMLCKHAAWPALIRSSKELFQQLIVSSKLQISWQLVSGIILMLSIVNVACILMTFVLRRLKYNM